MRTDKHWLLGRWLAAARSWGETAQEKAQLEYDARSVITIWTPKAYVRLREYANREWNGLLKDYYRPRWAAYFADVIKRVEAGDSTLPPSEPANWQASSEAWTKETKTYPTEPAGGPGGTDLAVAPSQDGRLELLLSSGSGVLHRYQGTGSGDWTSFAPGGRPAGARLAVGRDPLGLIHLVAVTQAEAWQRRQVSANAGWGEWHRVDVGGADVSVAANLDGRLEVRVARADQVWVRFQRSPDFVWSEWLAFGGPSS